MNIKKLINKLGSDTVAELDSLPIDELVIKILPPVTRHFLPLIPHFCQHQIRYGEKIFKIVVLIASRISASFLLIMPRRLRHLAKNYKNALSKKPYRF